MLSIGMDVHTDSIAAAYAAKDHDADVADRGTTGTRLCDLEKLIRHMQSKAKRLIFIYEAGSCGNWLYRELRKKGTSAGWWRPPSFRKKPVTA
jgi:hypothetical protein